MSRLEATARDASMPKKYVVAVDRRMKKQKQVMGIVRRAGRRTFVVVARAIKKYEGSKPKLLLQTQGCRCGAHNAHTTHTDAFLRNAATEQCTR